MRLQWILIVITAAACERQPEPTFELQALKNVLATEREAHFKKNVSLLLSNGTDTVWDVNHGVVRLLTPEQSKQRFTHYFNTVEFIRWDDTVDPVFFFSADSSMAVAIVQKQVIVESLPDANRDTTNFAWTAVYKKIATRWTMISITSTTK